MFAMMLPLVVFIPPFYVEHMGLGMAEVGAIIALGRIFDGVTDPAAGVLMDRTQRWVSRKAWVVLGAVPLVVATWQIFFAEPPGQAETLLFWLIVLYTGWTLMSVGLYSWASQVSPDYHERSRIMGAIQLANNLGTIGVLLIPTVVELLALPGDISVLRVHAMGAFVLTMVPVTLLIAWYFAPRGRGALRETSQDIWPVLKRAAKNEALLRLIGVDLVVGLKVGATSVMSVFLVEIVLELDGRAGTVTLLMVIASLLSIPVFLKLAEHVEKHRVLVINSVFAAAGGIIILFTPVQHFMMVALAYAMFGVASGVTQLLVRSIMVDVADGDRLSSGTENSGLYFSFFTTTLKLGIALGGALSFMVAEWVGFDPTIARTDDSAHWVLRAVVGIWPICAAIIVALLAWRFPFGKERYEMLQDIRDEYAAVK